MNNYILIDRRELTVLHKHANRMALCAVDWIECHNLETAIFEIGGWGFKGLSDLQMATLYMNLTGSKLITHRAHMEQVLQDALQRLPASDIVHVEAHDQARKVKREDKGHYRYAKGQAEPTPASKAPSPRTVEANQEAEADKAYTAPLVAPNTEPVFVPCTPAPFAASAPASREPGATPRVTTPRQGGTRAIVFEVADKMWEAAGKPTTQSDVLKLRKQMMETLEVEHGVKRTTSSNTLGEWQKSRM